MFNGSNYTSVNVNTLSVLVSLSSVIVVFAELAPHVSTLVAIHRKGWELLSPSLSLLAMF